MSTVINENILKGIARCRPGSLISYHDTHQDKKLFGIFSGLENDKLWAYWQRDDYDKKIIFKEFDLKPLYIDLDEYDYKVETDWSLIKNFRNIPKTALRK